MTRSSIARMFILVALAATGCARGRIDPQFSAEPRLEASVEALCVEVMKLRAQLDSLAALHETLRGDTARLATDLRARDELIRAMRSELQRLKEIDLKPRPRRVP